MTARNAVAAGDGLVMVREGVVLVVLEPGAQAASTESILRAAQGHQGDDLMREIARLIMHDDNSPSLGVIVGSLESATVLLHGEICFAAEVDGMTIGGEGVGGHEWVERSLPGAAAWIGVGALPDAPPEGAWWDLRDGTTQGNTVWIIGAPAHEVTAPPEQPAATPAETPAPPPAAAPAPPPQVQLVDLQAAEPPAPRPPLPPASASHTIIPQSPQQAAESTSNDDAPEAMVRGVQCPEGHHNNPRASYCSTCGRRMGVSHSMILVDGPRPPLGVLILDDGTSIPVVRDMVLGRDPSQHPLVKDGLAQGVPIIDSAQSISRAHLHVKLDEWELYVVDLDSSNGTFAYEEDAGSWRTLKPGDPYLLEGRDRVRLGDREVLFAQHHVRE